MVPRYSRDIGVVQLLLIFGVARGSRIASSRVSNRIDPFLFPIEKPLFGGAAPDQICSALTPLTLREDCSAYNEERSCPGSCTWESDKCKADEFALPSKLTFTCAWDLKLNVSATVYEATIPSTDLQYGVDSTPNGFRFEQEFRRRSMRSAPGILLKGHFNSALGRLNLEYLPLWGLKGPKSAAAQVVHKYYAQMDRAGGDNEYQPNIYHVAKMLASVEPVGQSSGTPDLSFSGEYSLRTHERYSKDASSPVPQKSGDLRTQSKMFRIEEDGNFSVKLTGGRLAGILQDGKLVDGKVLINPTKPYERTFRLP